MNSAANNLETLTDDQMVAVLTSVTSVCRTGLWMDGRTATDEERATCRSLLRKANAALLATGRRVQL
jgi:hypothetical protein